MSTRESVDAGGSPNARGRKLSGVTKKKRRKKSDVRNFGFGPVNVKQENLTAALVLRGLR